MLSLAWVPGGQRLGLVSRGQVCLSHSYLSYLGSTPPEGLDHNREETVTHGPTILCAVNLKEILLWEKSQ